MKPSLSLIAVIAVGALAGCGGSSTTTIIQQAPTTTSPTTTQGVTVPGGSGTVSPGEIGPLRFDQSRESDVTAFAGPSEQSTLTGPIRPDAPKLQELGYDCTPAGPKGPGTCKTIYWISQATKRLVAFTTQSPNFSTPTGIRPGTSVVELKAKEPSAKPYCGFGYVLATAPGGWSTLDVVATGGTVGQIELTTATPPDVGVTNC